MIQVAADNWTRRVEYQVKDRAVLVQQKPAPDPIEAWEVTKVIVMTTYGMNGKPLANYPVVTMYGRQDGMGAIHPIPWRCLVVVPPWLQEAIWNVS